MARGSYDGGDPWASVPGIRPTLAEFGIDVEIAAAPPWDEVEQSDFNPRRPTIGPIYGVWENTLAASEYEDVS